MYDLFPCTLHYHINHQCTCAMETHVSWLLTFTVIVFFKADGNIEEKLLLHVAIVAKCLDDNIPKKTSLKLFQTSWSDSFKMLAKFSVFEFKRTISKFRIRKRKFFCCVHLLHKVGAWNEEVSCHIRAMTVKKFKKRLLVVWLSFCWYKHFAFLPCLLPLPSLLLKLTIVVMQQFWL